MNTSSSMRKFPSRKELELTALPKDADLPEEESESPTPRLPEGSNLRTPGLPEELKSPTQVQNNVKDRDQPDKKSWSNPEVIGEVLKWCIQIGVTITVLVFQFRGWPQVPDVYITDNPWNTSRGGETYTCECIVPENLTANTSLNFCHERGSLDDVKILAFSDPDKLSEAVSKAGLGIGYYYSEVPGYMVTQDAYGFQGSINISDYATEFNLEDFFIGGYPQPNKYVELDNQVLLNPNFLSFSIQSYVRFYFEYYCDNCVDCGPDEVNQAWDEIINSNDWWVSCFFGNSSKQTCKDGDDFFVKCVGYPTTTLPPSGAIWKFLNKIVELHGSLNLSVSGVRNEPKYYMTLEPSHFYLDIGQVQNSSISLNFMEVKENSALWVSLLSSLPTLANECATMGFVSVCNVTSVCNLFADPIYDHLCLSMYDQTQCKQLVTSANGTGESTLDITNRNTGIWSPLNVTSWLDLACPELICQNVHPSFVQRRRIQPSNLWSNPLKRFLHSWLLDDILAQISDGCMITYHDVYRYRFPGEGVDGVPVTIFEDKGIFLETNCKGTGWKNPNDKCWLTGRYHNFNDSPTDEWKQVGKDDPLFLNITDKEFICSGRKKQGFGSWFIATMGILFGWIGTVELIWKWFAKRIQPWIIRKKGN